MSTGIGKVFFLYFVFSLLFILKFHFGGLLVLFRTCPSYLINSSVIPIKVLNQEGSWKNIQSDGELMTQS